MTPSTILFSRQDYWEGFDIESTENNLVTIHAFWTYGLTTPDGSKPEKSSERLNTVVQKIMKKYFILWLWHDT